MLIDESTRCGLLARQGSLRLITSVAAFTTLAHPLKTPLFTSANEIIHQDCLRTCDIIFGDFSHALFVLYAVSRTGKVDCCNFIVRLRASPRCVDTISQGMLRNGPRLARMRCRTVSAMFPLFGKPASFYQSSTENWYRVQARTLCSTTYSHICMYLQILRSLL